jgi:hypothetical protein
MLICLNRINKDNFHYISFGRGKSPLIPLEKGEREGLYGNGDILSHFEK